MRTTIDISGPLPRRLWSMAALEGTTLKHLVHDLIERGLGEPAARDAAPRRPAPPGLRIGQPPDLGEPSNARLFALLDDA